MNEIYLTYNNTHTNDAKFERFAFAAELGIPPGPPPKALYTKSMGNRQPFNLIRVSPDGGMFVYRQEFGTIELTVFND